jgi:tetratricopeptide (TPR) repeat protein
MEASDIETRLGAAAAAMRAGQKQKAIAQVESVLAASPNHPGARHMRGAIHLSMDEAKQAVPHLRVAVAAGLHEAGVGVAALASLGAALTQSGEMAAGIEALLEAAALSPGNAQIAISLGQAYQQMGNAAEAESWLRKATELAPKFERTHLALGRLLFDLRKFSKARACFELVLTLQPDHVAATYNLALINQLQGLYAEAATGFAKCRPKLGPTRPLMLAWGQCLQELGRMDEALGVYRDLLATDPDAYSAVLRTLTTASKGLFDSNGAGLRAMLKPAIN